MEGAPTAPGSSLIPSSLTPEHSCQDRERTETRARGYDDTSGGRGGAASARSAPRSDETANGEIEANEHHERDNPLIALGRAVRDDEHAAVVNVRRASPQEGVKFLIRAKPVLPSRSGRPLPASNRPKWSPVRASARSAEQDGWYRGKGRCQERKVRMGSP